MVVWPSEGERSRPRVAGDCSDCCPQKEKMTYKHPDLIFEFAFHLFSGFQCCFVPTCFSAQGSRGLDSTSHSEHDRAGNSTHSRPATRRVVEGGRRSRVWSFRFGTLHQSCACTHRHRIWFLFCLSSQLACDFIQRRYQCLCFSGGMVPVPMVGLRARVGVQQESFLYTVTF